MRLLSAILLTLGLAAPAWAQVDVSGYPVASHPAEDYQEAVAVFNAGDRQTGACLFYRGQYRFRVYLMARPELDPSGESALMASLNEVVGRPINEWLGGDVDEFLAVLDCALDWAARHDDPLTPKASFGAAHDEVRAGLEELRAMMAADPEAVREQRRLNGLPNR